MKKTLRKSIVREQRSLQLYSPCNCTNCSGCSGTPSWNYVNINDVRNAAKTA